MDKIAFVGVKFLNRFALFILRQLWPANPLALLESLIHCRNEPSNMSVLVNDHKNILKF